MPRGARGNADLVTRRSVLWIDEWRRRQPKDPSVIDASAHKSSEAGETRKLRIRSDPFSANVGDLASGDEVGVVDISAQCLSASSVILCIRGGSARRSLALLIRALAMGPSK